MLQGCRSDPLPFGRRKNPPTKIVTEISVCKFGGWKLSYETVSTTYTAIRRISDNSSHSIRSTLFNRVNPDRVTFCGTHPPVRRFLVPKYRRIIVFSQQTENQHYFDYFKEAPYILTMNRIIVIHSLSLIRFRRFRATPILKKLTGSLSQDFRWRVHDNWAFPPILILRTFESTQLSFYADRNRFVNKDASIRNHPQ